MHCFEINQSESLNKGNSFHDIIFQNLVFEEYYPAAQAEPISKFFKIKFSVQSWNQKKVIQKYYNH